MNSKSLTYFATAAGVAAAPASAAIIFTELEVPLTAESTTDSIFFSLSEQWAASSNQTLGGEVFRLYFYDNGQQKPALFTQNTSGEVALIDGYAERFSAGSPISGDQTFTNELTYINISGNNDANWAPGTRGFLGLKFDNNGTPNFGWADLEYGSDSNLTLYGFAYDNSGAAIPAGVIPEPRATVFLAALAAGSVALLARRRRAARTNAGA